MELDACEGSVGEDLGIARVFLDTIVRHLALVATRRSVRHTLESTITLLFGSRHLGSTWVSLAPCRSATCRDKSVSLPISLFFQSHSFVRHSGPMLYQLEEMDCIIASAVAVGPPPGLTKT